jgi:GH24 family phage-related lysozyme (muramidase)
MTSRRRAVSDEGLAFIKAHEGFRARASRLPDGRWLVGHSSVESEDEGREITPEEADERLRRDLAPIEDAIDELVFAPLTQRQLDALASFGFSVGAEAFRSCGIADALNEGRPIDAADVLERWRCARVGDTVKPVDALVRRRAAEKAMFLALDDGPVAAPSALLRPAPNGVDHGPSASPWTRRAASGPGSPRAEKPGPDGAAEATDLRAQWPWLLGGGGLAQIAVALANVSAPAPISGSGGVEAAWVFALAAGVLALGAGVYYAARRLAGRGD